MFNWKEGGSKRNAGSHQITTDSTLKRKGPNILDSGREMYNNLPLNLRNNSLKPKLFKKELKIHTFDNNQLTKH